MLNHVFVGSNDLAKARTFYDAVLGALGHEAIVINDRLIYRGGDLSFVIAKPADGQAASFGNGYTIGFRATTTAQVDAFHAAGLANGGTCEGTPGIREQSPGRKYGAYLRDPDGNKICAFAPNPNLPA